MPLIYITLLIVSLSLIALLGLIFSFKHDVTITVAMVLGCVLLVGGVLPLFPFRGNVTLLQTPVFKSQIGYVATVCHDGVTELLLISDHTIIASTTTKDIKVELRELKCGFGFNTEKKYKLIVVNSGSKVYNSIIY